MRFIRHFFCRLRSAWAYGKLGFSFHCSCCYDSILDLLIFRLKEMISAKTHHCIDRRSDIRQMRRVVALLTRIRSEDAGYDLTPVGVFYNKDIRTIPNEVMYRRMSQRQRDISYCFQYISKHITGWWA